MRSTTCRSLSSRTPRWAWPRPCPTAFLTPCQTASKALGLLLLTLCLTIAPEAARAAITITDDQGAQVTLDAPAKRVIALYGAFNEILLALDAGDAIVARTVADADIPQLAKLPAIGTHMRPNHELVVAHKPDLVLQLTGRKEAQDQTESLRQLDIPVLCFAMQSFDDLFRVTRLLGQATGREAKAQQVIEGWLQRLKALSGRQVPARTSVFYEVRYPNLLAAGKNSIVNDIIAMAGGANVVTADKKLVRFSEESLLAANPQAYIVQQGPMNPAPQEVASRPHFAGLEAVKRGNILVVDEAAFARPGPRAIDAAEQLARWLDSLGQAAR